MASSPQDELERLLESLRFRASFRFLVQSLTPNQGLQNFFKQQQPGTPPPPGLPEPAGSASSTPRDLDLDSTQPPTPSGSASTGSVAASYQQFVQEIRNICGAVDPQLVAPSIPNLNVLLFTMLKTNFLRNAR